MYAYRNNLYWTEVPPPPEVSTEVGKRTVYYGFFCLWYGEEDINPTDTVSVLPISPIVHLQQTIEEEKMDVGSGNTVSSAVNLMGEFNTDRSSTAYFSSTAASSSSSSSSSTCFMNNTPPPRTTTTSGTTTINTPTQVLNTLSTGVPIETATTTTRSNTPSPTILKPADPVLTAYFANMINIPISNLVPVLRNSLLPLDEERTNNKYINGVKTYDLYRSLMIALVQFAEWDYPERDSYLWPDFILPIMKSSVTREKFFHTAVEHPLNINNYRQLSDIMLFLLCAQHSGLLEEWNDNAFNSSTGLPQCSDNIAELLMSIDVFKASKEKVFRPFCRAGEAYQVSPTSIPNCCTTPLPQQQLQQQHKGDSKHSIDFSAKEIKKLGIDIDSYLGEVHLLREKTLVPGQLIEAPLDLSSFMKCWEMRVKELQMENLPNAVTAKQRYEMRVQLDEFLAISRRRNRCLTSLCTVQEVVSVVPAVVIVPVVPAVVSKSSVDSVSIDSGIKIIGSAVESTEKLTALSLPAAPMSCPLQCDRPPSVTSVAIIPSTTTATAATTVPTFAPTTSTITSTTVVDATCAPPQTTSAFIPIKEIPSVSKTEVSPPTPASSRWVVVTYGGGQTLRVPVHFCRISTVPDDIALEVLHRQHGDVKAALKHIATMLTVSSSRNSSNGSAPSSSTSTLSKPHHNDEPSIHSSTTTSKSTAVHNTHTCSPTTTTTARRLKLDMKTNRIVISTEDLCAFHSLANR